MMNNNNLYCKVSAVLYSIYHTHHDIISNQITVIIKVLPQNKSNMDNM